MDTIAGARRLLLVVAAVVSAATARATSIVPPENLGELARLSEAVVLAQAGSSRVSVRGSLLFTLTSFRILEPVSGPLEREDRITVEAPGGELEGIAWVVPGSPRFTPGGAYLLFLDERPTGEWMPKTMAYGLLRRIAGRDGSALLTPLPEQADVQPFVREDGILPEPVETYVEAALLSHLRAVAAGWQEWRARAVLARSEQVPMEAYAQAIPAGCAFLSSGGTRFRWRVFDSGG